MQAIGHFISVRGICISWFCPFMRHWCNCLY